MATVSTKCRSERQSTDNKMGQHLKSKDFMSSLQYLLTKLDTVKGGIQQNTNKEKHNTGATSVVKPILISRFTAETVLSFLVIQFSKNYCTG